MSKKYFFDTSALIKLYHNELGTDDLADMLASQNPEILISDLTLIEMVSAFAKKVRMNDIDRDTFKEIMIMFESDIRLFDIVEITKDMKLHAAELLKSIGVQRGLKTLDALQLSCALKASENESVDCFIVSDKILGEIAESQGLTVHTA